MPQNKRYQKEEVEFIENNYKRMTVSDISEHLGRSEKAVRGKMERMNLQLESLDRNKPFEWTTEKDAFLIENYQKMKDEDIATVIGTSEGIVFRRREKLGLKKKSKEPFIQSSYWQRFEDGKRIWIHREVASKKLGRELNLSEPVHHVDGDKLNNLPDNLYVCKNKKEHGKVHDSLENVAFELYKNGLIKFNHDTGEYYHELPIRTED